MPNSKEELLVTLARFQIPDPAHTGLGPQSFHGRFVVLINEWTDSGAEMVANFATENELATLIGQKTRRNVLGAMNFDIGGGWLRLPVFGWFTSQGKSLEGIGVDPHIGIDVSAVGLATGEDSQIIKSIEILTVSGTANASGLYSQPR